MIKKKISLSDIKIDKKISINNKNDIIYNLYHNNKLITQAFVITKRKSKDALIYNDYKSKDVTKLLFDYIEKDLKLNLKPSLNELVGNGKKFWENRLSRKNPTDKEFLQKIKITKNAAYFPVTSSIIIKYHVYYDNKEIGYFKLTEGYNFIDNMRVDEKFQHRGLATFMHDYIEQDLGIKIIPSEDLTDDGEEFYKFRSKKK